MSEQLLRIEGMSKSFPGVRALHDVRLDLSAGEVHALVGENGAGKSTLMKILSGLYERDEGTILLDGERVEIDSPLAAQHLGISIIHQELHLMPDLTIAENIWIGRERRRLGIFADDRDLNRRTLELFDRLGISMDPRAKVGGLKVAQQQLVEIAKALSFNARVLIMDEPTAALTDSETEVLFGLIRDLRDRGVGIIYISHRMEELKAIADRITVLRDGEYIDTLITAETDVSTIISLMVGRTIVGETRPAVDDGPDRPVILQVDGLSSKDLLRDVSFDLREGEILGFAGLMGAGRTEVARAIVGADPITAGTIRLRGEQVHIAHPADAARLGIGYLSEDRKRFGLMLDQDVSFNVAISSLGDHRGPLGLVRDGRIRSTAQRLVKALNIRTPSVRKRTKQLSGGNQQKIVIAKWLAKDCDILIFDEPTRGIDVGAKEEIYALLNELAGRGKSIIVISSELPEVLRLAHRVVVMAEGRVTGVLDNADADQENIMEHATRVSAHGIDA